MINRLGNAFYETFFLAAAIRKFGCGCYLGSCKKLVELSASKACNDGSIDCWVVELLANGLPFF